LHVQAVQAGKIAFGKTEIMDRVQEIGLTHTVLATDPNDPFGNSKTPVTVVFELNQRYVLKTKH
jgi:hypothetical protein